jgi:hypothetical protein
VRGQHAVAETISKKVVKGCVAEVAGSLFDSLAGVRDVCRDVYVSQMQRDFEASAEIGDEGCVGVGLCAAQIVMNVDSGEDGSEGIAGLAVGGVEGEEQGNGVGSA